MNKAGEIRTKLLSRENGRTKELKQRRKSCQP